MTLDLKLQIALIRTILWSMGFKIKFPAVENKELGFYGRRKVTKSFEKELNRLVKSGKIPRQKTWGAKTGKDYKEMKQVILERGLHGEILGRKEIPVKDLMKKSDWDWGISKTYVPKTGKSFNHGS